MDKAEEDRYLQLIQQLGNRLRDDLYRQFSEKLISRYSLEIFKQQNLTDSEALLKMVWSLSFAFMQTGSHSEKQSQVKALLLTIRNYGLMPYEVDYLAYGVINSAQAFLKSENAKARLSTGPLTIETASLKNRLANNTALHQKMKQHESAARKQQALDDHLFANYLQQMNALLAECAGAIEPDLMVNAQAIARIDGFIQQQALFVKHCQASPHFLAYQLLVNSAIDKLKLKKSELIVALPKLADSQRSSKKLMLFKAQLQGIAYLHAAHRALTLADDANRVAHVLVTHSDLGKLFVDGNLAASSAKPAELLQQIQTQSKQSVQDTIQSYGDLKQGLKTKYLGTDQSSNLFAQYFSQRSQSRLTRWTDALSFSRYSQKQLREQFIQQQLLPCLTRCLIADPLVGQHDRFGFSKSCLISLIESGLTLFKPRSLVGVGYQQSLHCLLSKLLVDVKALAEYEPTILELAKQVKEQSLHKQGSVNRCRN